MSRNYWLDLFTGKTWEEFKKHGAEVSGFRRRRRRIAKEEIQPGDYLICYLTGLSRFIGVLEVKSKAYEDDTPIWEDAVFPIRFKVELIYELTADTAVPVLDLKDKLSMFENMPSPHAWTGFFRGSPTRFKPADGQVIVEAIKEAIAHPVTRKYDEAKYRRRPRKFESKKAGVVTIPEEEKEDAQQAIATTSEPERSTHEEIQWLLLKVGSGLGLDVWVARNDRNRSFNGMAFSDIKGLRTELPRQFDDATNRTIELIDVLWLRGDAIVAAFEVEHTTAIYSGLLRMADLITMQPNIKINLYLVAPDERFDKVYSEINRPTFSRLRPSLPQICKFIPYSALKDEIEKVGSRLQYMKPEFIEAIAVSCEPDEA
jgi:hypothetical protein